MNDLFQDKAADWDTLPIPTQISDGVFSALSDHIALSDDMQVMDFGAGTGLICTRLAPKVAKLHAVDVSAAMLDKLAAKPELKGKVDIHCQNILEEPLDLQVDLVVSAMAMHHVDDTSSLLKALHKNLAAGGRLALADLDAEDGSFHPPGIDGVFHSGFERAALQKKLEAAGFAEVHFVTATEIKKDERSYPVFLMTATKA